MAHTIFILGTDPQQCKELKEILQGRVADEIVTSNGNDLPTISESDTVIITSEEKNTGILYRQLLTKLEDQVHRAELLSQLIRLFSSSIHIDELLDRVVLKSTEVIGDTAFILLAGDTGQLKLEAAYSTDHDRLVRMLITTINTKEHSAYTELLGDILGRRETILISNLPHTSLTAEMRSVVERYGIMSLLAVPIQTKEAVLGAFVSLTTQARMFTNDDVATASALADFTAIALENAGLFAELQRSAITDS